MPKRNDVAKMDNIAWLVHICTFSDHGALMQAFVLDAMYKYATKVASMDVSDVEKALEGTLIAGHAWHGTAKELVRRFEERGP